MDKFNQRKKDILEKLDKSSKGDWDEKIKWLCDKINSMDNYYTTSSCSGRIIVMKDEDKKGPNLFSAVWHDLVELNDFMNKITLLCSDVDGSSQTQSRLSQKNLVNSQKKFATKGASKGGLELVNLKFKQEPPILHVACKNLEDAFILLEKARKIGWRRSGIISEGKMFIVELVSTEKLEFPLTEKGKLLVDSAFLKIVLEKANGNLEKGWDKINKLRNSL